VNRPETAGSNSSPTYVAPRWAMPTGQRQRASACVISVGTALVTYGGWPAALKNPGDRFGRLPGNVQKQPGRSEWRACAGGCGSLESRSLVLLGTEDASRCQALFRLP